MPKGYQILELECIDALIVNPIQFGFSVAVLSWLIERLHVELAENLGGAELSIVRVEYLGAYPALGVAYGQISEDVGPLIQKTATELFQKCNVGEFVQFMLRKNVDWNAVASEIMRGD